MRASKHGVVQPTVYSFEFGSFQIANIMDGKVVREALRPSFGIGRPIEEADELCPSLGRKMERRQRLSAGR